MRRAWAGLVAGLLFVAPAFAWGPQGHGTVGAIADRLLVGTRAGAEASRVLNGESLQVAALWADCVKGVTERWPQHYTHNPRFRECQAFESGEGRIEMEDYVRRNLDACGRGPGQESCHKQYHYTDVAVQRRDYSRQHVGTSDHDIVAAINACIAVLQGKPTPKPFAIQSRREALRLLAHFVGDIHQPLHVGAIYLDEDGGVLDPDAKGFRAASDTHGGNALLHGKERLHALWDSTPPRLKAGRFAAKGEQAARPLRATQGPLEGWAQAWASESLRVSETTFAGMRFGAKGGEGVGQSAWRVQEMPRTLVPQDVIKEQQLVKAGARLAQLLQTIWP